MTSPKQPVQVKPTPSEEKQEMTIEKMIAEIPKEIIEGLEAMGRNTPSAQEGWEDTFTKEFVAYLRHDRLSFEPFIQWATKFIRKQKQESYLDGVGQGQQMACEVHDDQIRFTEKHVAQVREETVREAVACVPKERSTKDFPIDSEDCELHFSGGLRGHNLCRTQTLSALRALLVNKDL